MESSLTRCVLGLALLACVEGCGSSLAQPFDQMKGQPIRILRLQNYEPPPPPPNAAPQGNLLPPQIQQWLSGPPPPPPPRLLPGGTPAPPPQQDAARFHNFRILGWMDINDDKQRDEVLDIFGHESSFTAQHGGCLFAEFGFSITQKSAPAPADVLVSLSCDN